MHAVMRSIQLLKYGIIVFVLGISDFQYFYFLYYYLSEAIKCFRSLTSYFDYYYYYYKTNIIYFSTKSILAF